MKIVINGDCQEVPGGSSAADVVHAVVPGSVKGSDVAGMGRRVGGLAVAVNEDVVPRSRWAQTALAEGDRVEILIAVQGG
jgi:sulfur carrier protein